MTIDEVAAGVIRLGRGAMMAKFDLKLAYRQVTQMTALVRDGVGRTTIC